MKGTTRAWRLSESRQHGQGSGDVVHTQTHTHNKHTVTVVHGSRLSPAPYERLATWDYVTVKRSVLEAGTAVLTGRRYLQETSSSTVCVCPVTVIPTPRVIYRPVHLIMKVNPNPIHNSRQVCVKIGKIVRGAAPLSRRRGRCQGAGTSS